MGLRRVTWAPRISECSAEIAMIVGLCFMRDFQMSCNRSEEASPSQSITSRSVLPLANMPSAWEEFKQRFVRTDKSRSSPSIGENTAGSLQMNKHSKAISGVITSLHGMERVCRRESEWRLKFDVDLSTYAERPPSSIWPRCFATACSERSMMLGQLKVPTQSFWGARGSPSLGSHVIKLLRTRFRDWSELTARRRVVIRANVLCLLVRDVTTSRE